MIPGSIIKLKNDRRFKRGHIVRDQDGTFRGHPESMEIKPMHVPYSINGLSLNPPLVISSELAAAIKGLEENKS